MVNLLDLIIVKRRNVIVNEIDIVKVLKALDTKHINDVRIGNCGWNDDAHKWFIYFKVSNNKWHKLVRELGISRVWKFTDIPVNGDGIYSTN